MRTICYVILNYKTYEEAAACAESILSTQTWKNMHIVIVDNGSGNGSEEWLVEHFIDEKRVRVIASGENLGFARGNNLGIRYAREHYDPDLIVAANSDILFEQPVFVSACLRSTTESRMRYWARMLWTRPARSTLTRWRRSAVIP